MQKGRTRKIINVLIITILSMQILSVSVFALENPCIVFDAINKQFEFTVCTEDSTSSSNALVVLYDDSNTCCSLGVNSTNFQDNTIVKVPFNKNYSSYKTMLWGGENAIKPFGTAVRNTLKPWQCSDSLTILSDNVQSYDAETAEISYCLFDDEDEVTAIAIDKTAQYMLYDGIMCEFDTYDFEDILDKDDVILYLADSNFDMLYEDIKVCQYTYKIVENVDLSRDAISFLNDRKLYLNFEDTTVSIVDSMDNELSLSDIKPGDFLAILCDNPRNVDEYYDYIKIIKLTDSVVSGTAKETYIKNGESYIVIDGKEYLNISDKNINENDSGNFYITLSGKLFDYIIDYDALNYAYILQGELFENEWYFTILTENGDVVTLPAEDSEAAQEYIMQNTDAFDVADGEFSFESATERQKADSARFVTYEISKDGKIAMETAEYYRIWRMNTQDYVYDELNHKVGKYKLKDDMLIFDVSNGIDSAFVTDESHLKDYVGYSGFLFSNPIETSAYSVMLITNSRDFNLETSKGIAIALETNETEIKFIQDEREKVFTVNNAEILNASAKLPKYGDVFYYYDNNLDKDIEAIITIATLEKDENGQAYFVLTDEADTPEEIGAIWSDNDVSVEVGYVLNERKTIMGSKEIITLSTDKKVIVSDTANGYLYHEDAVEINSYIEYAYEDNGTIIASPIFVRLENGEVDDMYTTTGMFVME